MSAFAISPRWKKVVIVGPGLIGASIGLALKRSGLVEQIVGVSRRNSTLEVAQASGAIDSGSCQLDATVRDATAVIVCTPVRRIAEQVITIAEHLQTEDRAWITDAGSAKEMIVRRVSDAEASSKHAIPFVGSHPLAGSEQSGPQAARADLYDGRIVIVTPTAKTPPWLADEVHLFWTSLGAKVHRLTPTAHDRVLAATSHLPHTLATALAAATLPDQLSLAATGWRDTTRIAAGDPDLWCDILLDNRTHILNSLDIFEKKLSAIRDALERQDSQQLKRLLEEGKQRRDSLGS
jgi:prephenate dehydrogenase